MMLAKIYTRLNDINVPKQQDKRPAIPIIII